MAFQSCQRVGIGVKLPRYLCMSLTTNQPPASTSQPQFLGFDRPRQNWFRLPYQWTDITAKITSLAELKVVEYVLKHTWGYQEYDLKKRISLDEFRHGRKRKDGTTIDQGTGLSKQSVIDGLKNAVKHGFLEVEKDDSDQARKKRYYSLRMQESIDQKPPTNQDREHETPDTTADRVEWIADLQSGASSGEAEQGEEGKHLDADVKNLDIRGPISRHRSEKDTSERYFNNNKEVVDVLIAEGIETKTAHQLACIEHVTLDFVLKQIDQRDFLLETAPDRVKRPTAFLVRAIQRAFPKPDGYKPKDIRESEAAAQLQKGEEDRRRQARIEQQVTAEQVIKQRVLDQKRQAEIAQLNQLQARWGTRDKEKQLWQRVLTELQVQLKWTIGYSVIEHSVLLSTENGEVVIAVLNNWARDYVTKRLSHPICQALEQHLSGQSVKIRFITTQTSTRSLPDDRGGHRVTADSHPDRQLSFG